VAERTGQVLDIAGAEALAERTIAEINAAWPDFTAGWERLVLAADRERVVSDIEQVRIHAHCGAGVGICDDGGKAGRRAAPGLRPRGVRPDEPAAHRRPLREDAMTAPAWEPTRWWRSVLVDGSLWCESSDEQEVRAAAARAPTPATVERLMQRTQTMWVSS
jgi:hypothetical protein